MKKLFTQPELTVIDYDILESIAAISYGGVLSTEPGEGDEDGEDFSL